MNRFVILAVVILTTANAYAQDCNQILQYGIWETQSRDENIVNTQQFANWACSAQAQSDRRGTTLNVPGYGSFDKQASMARSSNDCSSASGNYELSSTFRERMKTAAVSLVDAWSRCISAVGSHASILYGPSGSFTIQLRRVVDTGVARAVARIISLPAAAVNCTLSPDELSAGVEFEGSRTILCQRSDPSKSVDIEVNFTPGGGRSLFVPAVVPSQPPPPRSIIQFPVTRITRSTNVEVGGGLAKAYGADVLHNAPPYKQPRPNTAEFDFDVDVGGKYRLEIEYAALESRPVEISINGSVVAGAGLALTTESWTAQQWKEQGDVVLRPGKNTLRLYRPSVFPHIRTVRFTPVK
jgi:hypothetical protein